MKIILFAILSFPLFSVCQVTLTQQNHEPIAGDKDLAIRVQDSVTAVPRNTGTNQIWDFSNIVTASFTYTTNYVAPNFNFQGASVVNQYSCYVSNANPASWQNVGYPNTTVVEYNFTDPEIIMKWPFTYSSSFSDSFSYSGHKLVGSVDSFTAAGQRIVQGTGTGTVITPNGQIFPNALQVTVHRYDTSFHSKQGPLWTEYETNIERLYYVANRKFPIVGEFYGTCLTNPSGFEHKYSKPTLWIASDLTSVGITEQSGEEYMRISPTICDNYVNISCDLKDPLRQFQIFDINANLLINNTDADSGAEQSISIASLEEGLFIIVIQTSNNIFRKKFIINR